ncbi:unnamed protein product [Ilex paraguariensis]|uniref:Replication factor C subunit 3 n=1 Tax=Ilex paraguariensis TaxID=185542 RepID=A0ABC8S5E9_9AQUA
MEISSRHSRASQLQSLSTTRRRSGYEPSDTETEWHETPWHDHTKKNEYFGSEEPKIALDEAKNRTPSRSTRKDTVQFEHEAVSPIKALTASPTRRRPSKSPYKPRRDDGNARSPPPVSEFHRNVSPLPLTPGYEFSDIRKNISPFSKSERRRHVPSHKSMREDHDLNNYEIVSSNRKQNDRYSIKDSSKVSEKSNYSRRSASAPRPRSREKDRQIKFDHTDEKKEDRTPSPLPRNILGKDREASHKNASSVGEINEMIVNAKISRGPINNDPNFESTESISPGDIFFSRDYAALAMQKITFPKNGGFCTDRNPGSHQRNMSNGTFNHKTGAISSSTILTQTTTTNGSSVSRESDASGRTSESLKKFTANRQKRHGEAWFSCIKKVSCRTSKKSPEKERAFDEASFIEKAFVVESLRQFWADKHQPTSLNGFICHKKEAQLLKQLIATGGCPHILLKGPSGSGKKALAMALLHEIYGDTVSNITHDLRYFQIQEARPMEVVVPVTSSAHHVELNVYLEPNARYALMALVKQISSNYAVTPEISNVNFNAADYTVLVLYDVDKVSESIQHLIKWIMDCYTDACKLILCCEDDVDILEPVKDRCKVFKIDAPVTHEIMEVLIQIARKEDIELSMSFAAKIATKSKQNQRKAIMALEACKAHNYPFADDQPIPMGWEEVLVEIAAEILADPSPKRLFLIRGKFQKLLVDFVHPKLMLLKLVEQFLKGVEASLKRELYYWHAYYDKRLPMGTSALLKLEEFVAKFMSIYRKSSSNSLQS